MPTLTSSAKNNALLTDPLNPAPQAGQGAYGKVPGPITYPTTPYAEASRIYPGFAQLTPLALEEIRSQIMGEFSPAEEAALWDVSNRYGVQSGMPGAQLWSNRFMGNRIDEGMKRRQQGVENYNITLQTLAKLGVDPALAAEIENRNATMGAAPDPEAATRALEAAYRNALNPAAGTLNNIGTTTNKYGTGFYNALMPSATSPAAGTRSTMPSTVNPFPAPTNPTKPGYGATWNSTGGYADTSGNVFAPVTADNFSDPYGMDYITTGADPYGAFDFTDNYGMDYLTTGLDPYGYFDDTGGYDQSSDYNPFPNDAYAPTPIYEDELAWLWGEEDPWSIYGG